MNGIKTFLLALALSLSLFAPARIITDTLYSAQGDRVIITYETTQHDNKVDVRFRSTRKNLGDALRKKYSKNSEINLLFFDHVGIIKDMTFTGTTPRAFSLPSGIGYTKSPDSYFVIDNQPAPSLTFDLKSAGEKVVSIPVYLAHYEKKCHYKILYLCGNLNIKIGSSAKPYQEAKDEAKPQYQILEMDDTLNEDEDEALCSLNTAKELLAKQESLPFDDNLTEQIKFLQKQKHNSKISKSEIIEQIDQFLEQYDATKKTLEEQARAQELVAQEEAERKADDDAYARCISKDDYEIYRKTHPDGQHLEEAEAKIEEMEAEARAKAEKEKKRNIWMIIGGVLMAILLFVGNQVLQSVRNIRTQRSMMQMQQDATNRAKNMAKSKAQGAIRKQSGKITNQAKQKGQTAMRNVIDKSTKKPGKNNRVSI